MNGPNRTSKSGAELFIVDNTHTESSGLEYLLQSCDASKCIDIATGYFEIGALLALDGRWQQVDKIRILMGDEVSLRTKGVFERLFAEKLAILEKSVEAEKKDNDFLIGVPAIVNALKTGKIECKVYRKDKFHAKTYIRHARASSYQSNGLVGSSNFTRPGLTQNIELNVQVYPDRVAVLQEWFEAHWAGAEDVTPEILKAIEAHVFQYTPFEIYAKSLYEYLKRHEQTADEWERTSSKMYTMLATYQKEGYQSAMKRVHKFNGAFVCDGVGLGKTFISLMLIERYIMFEQKNVALFVPKSGRESVWEANIRRYLPHLLGRFSRLAIYNHTDLMREKLAADFQSVKDRADIILIDEAHHFRNTGTKGESENERKSRYWQLHDIVGEKPVVFMTATPINNRMTDLLHLIELFSRRQDNYFAGIGVHSLAGHIRKLENAVLAASGEDSAIYDMTDAQRILAEDQLIRALLVQRSRKYVKESLKAEGSDVLFPSPRMPSVCEYSVRKTYGKLLEKVEDAFHKQQPLFTLSVYYPWEHYIGKEPIDDLVKGRQKQVVILIRTQFLKRFESSAKAFEMSCRNLLMKLLAWLEVHSESTKEKETVEKWKKRHKDVLEYINSENRALLSDSEIENSDDDVLPQEFIDFAIKKKMSPKEFNLAGIREDTIGDLDQLVDFLKELQDLKPSQDKKLAGLVNLLRTDKVLQANKVIIFTEFLDTARYLKNALAAAGISGLEQIDSKNNKDRTGVIQRFSPYYNGLSSQELVERGQDEIRVLISTDVLSEGLNLQDATRLINYDLHWNPVRLMQRIGRVDRRMDPNIEAKLVKDHPHTKKLRGEIVYWNFLPPDELDNLLSLYSRVTTKTIRISKTLGIEGGRLLSPKDDLDELRLFMDEYEGGISEIEKMRIELTKILSQNANLEERLSKLPGKVFSAKANSIDGRKGVFFCYTMPGLGQKPGMPQNDPSSWSEEFGETRWYFYDLAAKTIEEVPARILPLIQCKPETLRQTAQTPEQLVEIRKTMDKHLHSTLVRKLQAPQGVNPRLIAWMEIS